MNPPDGVKLALEACCIMLGISPDYVKVGTAKVVDYWQKSKKLVKDYKKLISRLESYDKDNVSEQTINKILPYVNNPLFNPEQIRNASNAAEGICKWVIAIYHYDIVFKEI
jgi:dynein heavy chain